mmetsp:Transcript_48759/g.105995  ORF Transcript_48759/g.105995 Transcript_48759/m.105995 type:complete len:154 (-) Transcript_48759:86-547(-)
MGCTFGKQQHIAVVVPPCEEGAPPTLLSQSAHEGKQPGMPASHREERPAEAVVAQAAIPETFAAAPVCGEVTLAPATAAQPEIDTSGTGSFNQHEDEETQRGVPTDFVAADGAEVQAICPGIEAIRAKLAGATSLFQVCCSSGATEREITVED